MTNFGKESAVLYVRRRVVYNVAEDQELRASKTTIYSQSSSS